MIIHEDSEILVVNKPAGVPVHGSRILEGRPKTLISMLRESTHGMVHPAHRLDRAVSGLMVLAKDRETLAALSRQFERREVSKTYLAVVRGWLEPSGVIDYPLGPAPDDADVGGGSRDATTSWECLAQAELNEAIPPYSTARYSLLKLQPATGRRHQLRRHMKHISHPIIGDTTYGRGEHNRLFRRLFDCHRCLLHSWKLGFRHPASLRDMTLEGRPNDAFLRAMTGLGWSDELR